METSVCLECGARKTSSKPRTSGILRFSTLMPEQTEHFLRQAVFSSDRKNDRDCLCRPAQKDGGGHMRLTPVHDLRDLFPVIHLFKLHMLDRCTGDNHAIVFIFFHILKMSDRIYSDGW